LSEAFPASAISYVFILVASWFLFSEAASWLQFIGSLCILTGVWLVARSQTETRS
jgi:drug/metabolite transporter (DMT)-like permease